MLKIIVRQHSNDWIAYFEDAPQEYYSAPTATIAVARLEAANPLMKWEDAYPYGHRGPSSSPAMREEANFFGLQRITS